MKAENGSIEVKFGGARALVKMRGNGMWVVRWREAGRGRSTTKVAKKGALDFAARKVRELAGGQGGRLMTVEDAQMVQRLRAVAGERSPFVLLAELEDAQARLGGMEVLGRALRHYEASGMARVERATMSAARKRFLDGYEARDRETTSTLRKELDLFCKTYGTLAVSDLTNDLLAAWVARVKGDGDAVEARTHNNRLNVWRTFLNRCRSWNLWPKGEKHPGELLERKREADRIPGIFTLPQVEQLLAAVREDAPALLNYLVIGCWLGLRPTEIQRLRPAAWDWERGYVDVSAEVAAKVMQHRFVPIPDNVRLLLGGEIKDPRQKTKTRGRWEAVCCGTDDAMHLSALARRHGIIEQWTPDVMRHSYISYRLAEGHGHGQVAEWAGNSESEVRRKYRRPLRAEDGAAWFAVGA
jgi:integrase